MVGYVGPAEGLPWDKLGTLEVAIADWIERSSINK